MHASKADASSAALPTAALPTPPLPIASAPVGRATKNQAALIGLYGELESSSPQAGTPFDGGSNIAQITLAADGYCIDPDVDRSATRLAFASTMHRDTADIYTKPIHGKTITQITSDPADDLMPAFHPDGATIAFASNRSGNFDIYTTTIDGGRPVQITSDPDTELHPTWSPDGHRIAYCKYGSQSARWEIWVMDTANPAVRRFLEYGLFPQWCPDPAQSKILFQRARQRGGREYGIWTLDYVDGEAMHPTEIVSASNAAVINPAWSPDGSRIVFVTVVEPESKAGTTPAQSDLWIVNLDGTGRVSLTNGQFTNYQPVWGSNEIVYFVSDRSGADNLWAVSAVRAMNAEHSATGVATAETSHHGLPQDAGSTGPQR